MDRKYPFKLSHLALKHSKGKKVDVKHFLIIKYRYLHHFVTTPSQIKQVCMGK